MLYVPKILPDIAFSLNGYSGGNGKAININTENSGNNDYVVYWCVYPLEINGNTVRIYRGGAFSADNIVINVTALGH